VENVAAAIALAAADDRAAGRVYNVGERESLTEREWAERIAAAAGWGGRFVTLPAERMPPHLLIPGNTNQHWTIDTTRIREELGYHEPVPQIDAIRRTIAWERANPTESSPHAFDYAAEDAALRPA
jgi:nucleoside-diphosphate-sugar epimerase